MSNREDDRPLDTEDLPAQDESAPASSTDDTDDDPAHSVGEDEGWTSEGGATPSGPATDVDPDA